MKKIFTLLLAGALFTGVQAQVTVTYKVDITNYLDSNTLDANGIRIGGNFAEKNATTGGNAMVDWSPSDANSAMTDEGDNIWAIEVTYPDSMVGDTQYYKFVNGDWGTNEGTDGTNIANDSCGVDDGSGNINRVLQIPEFATTVIFCWDQCAQCDGSEPVLNVEEVVEANALTVFPNPFEHTFTVQSATNAAIKNVTIMDLSGRVVAVISGERRSAVSISGADFGMNNGLYLVRVTDVDGTESITKVSAL